MSSDSSEPSTTDALEVQKRLQEKIDEGKAFYNRAERQREKRRKAAIIHFRGIPLVSDDKSSDSEWFVVQPKSRAYLLGPGFAEPTLMGPGKYPLTRIAAGVVQKLKFGAGENASGRLLNRLYVACTVSEMPIACDVSIPDIDQADMVQKWTDVLSSFFLRTRDNILGGCELQMSVICEAPVKLLKTFGSDQIRPRRQAEKQDGEQATIEQTQYNVTTDPGRSGLVGRIKEGVFTRMATYLFGEAEDVEFALNPEPFTVDHLYERISL
jgi:hypothetical protein